MRNLFNGEYYVQEVRGRARTGIHPSLRSDMGSENTEQPEYQVGDGCLVDQLVGQYLAEVAGLGPLVDPAHCRRALAAIHRYNSRRDLTDHACLQRTYVVNDEAALLVCDYGRGDRPKVPFPYYAEAWTGLEYTAAAHMIYAGMTAEGIDAFANVRVRYDGERRNPWNEPECGHHYARAMSAWSGLLAISGFRFHAADGELRIEPRARTAGFRCFWSTGTGWGTFEYAADGASLRVRVIDGTLPVQALHVALGGRVATPRIAHGTRALAARVTRRRAVIDVQLDQRHTIAAGEELHVG